MEKPINYVKEAFLRQENLIGLGGLLLFGILAPIPFLGILFAGAAAEGVYLLATSQNKRFRNAIRAKKNEDLGLKGIEEDERLLNMLGDNGRARYQDLKRVCEKILQFLETKDEVTKSMLEPSVARLDYLLKTHLRSLAGLRNILTYLDSGEISAIEKEISFVENELKDQEMSEKVREVKDKHLAILRQRQDKLKKARENVEILKTQVNTLESTIKYIGDQTAAMSNPQEISSQIQSVVEDLKISEQSVKDFDTFLEYRKEEAQKAEALPVQDPRLQGSKAEALPVQDLRLQGSKPEAAKEKASKPGALSEETHTESKEKPPPESIKIR